MELYKTTIAASDRRCKAQIYTIAASHDEAEYSVQRFLLDNEIDLTGYEIAYTEFLATTDKYKRKQVKYNSIYRLKEYKKTNRLKLSGNGTRPIIEYVLPDDIEITALEELIRPRYIDRIK